MRGIYTNKNFIGIFAQSIPYVVSSSVVDTGVGDSSQESMLLVRTVSAHETATRRALRDALTADFPNVSVLTRDEFRAQQQQQIDRFLTVLVAILALAGLIAILGIVNTLALSVFERTRELGLLRVVGMTRRQVRRMVRGESVIIAVLGGVVGLAVGVVWGWAFARALRDQGLSVVRVPVLELLGFVVVSMTAGVVAAVLPATRASRLDVLDAIAAE